MNAGRPPLTTPPAGCLFLPTVQLSLPKVRSQQAISKQTTSKSLGATSVDDDDDNTATLHLDKLPKKENGDMRTLLVHHAMETEEQNNLRLMQKIRDRMER